MVPEVSQLADLVPGGVKIEIITYCPWIIQHWQERPLWILWKNYIFSPSTFQIYNIGPYFLNKPNKQTHYTTQVHYQPYTSLGPTQTWPNLLFFITKPGSNIWPSLSLSYLSKTRIPPGIPNLSSNLLPPPKPSPHTYLTPHNKCHHPQLL